jgi:hypothetical protein
MPGVPRLRLACRNVWARSVMRCAASPRFLGTLGAIGATRQGSRGAVRGRPACVAG